MQNVSSSLRPATYGAYYDDDDDEDIVTHRVAGLRQRYGLDDHPSKVHFHDVLRMFNDLNRRSRREKRVTGPRYMPVSFAVLLRMRFPLDETPKIITRVMEHINQYTREPPPNTVIADGFPVAVVYDSPEGGHRKIPEANILGQGDRTMQWAFTPLTAAQRAPYELGTRWNKVYLVSLEQLGTVLYWAASTAGVKKEVWAAMVHDVALTLGFEHPDDATLRIAKLRDPKARPKLFMYETPAPHRAALLREYLELLRIGDTPAALHDRSVITLLFKRKGPLHPDQIFGEGSDYDYAPPLEHQEQRFPLSCMWAINNPSTNTCVDRWSPGSGLHDFMLERFERSTAARKILHPGTERFLPENVKSLARLLTYIRWRLSPDPHERNDEVEEGTSGRRGTIEDATEAAHCRYARRGHHRPPREIPALRVQTPSGAPTEAHRRVAVVLLNQGHVEELKAMVHDMFGVESRGPRDALSRDPRGPGSEEEPTKIRDVMPSNHLDVSQRTLAKRGWLKHVTSDPTRLLRVIEMVTDSGRRLHILNPLTHVPSHPTVYAVHVDGFLELIRLAFAPRLPPAASLEPTTRRCSATAVLLSLLSSPRCGRDAWSMDEIANVVHKWELYCRSDNPDVAVDAWSTLYTREEATNLVKGAPYVKSTADESKRRFIAMQNVWSYSIKTIHCEDEGQAAEMYGATGDWVLAPHQREPIEDHRPAPRDEEEEEEMEEEGQQSSRYRYHLHFSHRQPTAPPEEPPSYDDAMRQAREQGH